MTIHYDGSDDRLKLILNQKSSISAPQEIFITETKDIPQGHKNGIHCLYADMDSLELFKSIKDSDIRHVIPKNREKLESDFDFFIRLLQQKKLCLECFETQLPYGAPLAQFTFPISETIDKIALHQGIKDFLLKKNINSSIVDVVLQSSYELVSNVIYDAPQSYEARFPNSTSSQQIKVWGKICIVLYNEKILIYALDHFGSLNLDDMLEKVVSAHGKNSLQTDGPVGAGIGCKMIFEHMSDIFVFLEDKKNTLVGGVIPLNLGLLRARSSSKLFHFIQV